MDDLKTNDEGSYPSTHQSNNGSVPPAHATNTAVSIFLAGVLRSPGNLEKKFRLVYFISFIGKSTKMKKL